MPYKGQRLMVQNKNFEAVKFYKEGDVIFYGAMYLFFFYTIEKCVGFFTF